MEQELDMIFVNGTPELRHRPTSPQKLSSFHGYCGCGRIVRYLLHTGKLACNKYSRCSITKEGGAALEYSNQTVNSISQVVDRDMHWADKLGAIRAIIDGLPKE